MPDALVETLSRTDRDGDARRRALPARRAGAAAPWPGSSRPVCRRRTVVAQPGVVADQADESAWRPGATCQMPCRERNLCQVLGATREGDLHVSRAAGADHEQRRGLRTLARRELSRRTGDSSGRRQSQSLGRQSHRPRCGCAKRPLHPRPHYPAASPQPSRLAPTPPPIPTPLTAAKPETVNKYLRRSSDRTMLLVISTTYRPATDLG